MGWRARRGTGATKKVSVRQVIEAIRQNGLPQARGKFWADTDGNPIHYIPTGEKVEIGSACALGQAALNLGIRWEELNTELSSVAPDLRSDIINQNDSFGYSLESIYQSAISRYDDSILDRTIEVQDIEVYK